jgi:hypothetical protein
MGLSDVTAEAVRGAIAECDELGRVPFRLRYHFGPAREYELVYDGRRYDSKAIMGVAHRNATGRLLTSDDFSGGSNTVARRLRELGFTVVREQAGGSTNAQQPLVLIAPCYGEHGSRARFADTLAREVAFADPPVRDYLTDEELEMLLKLHPGGTARFWGATSRYDSDIDDLAVGDPILFTGDLHVQAIAKVGGKLRNRALADALWPPEPGKDSWSNVYSVLDFRRVSDLLYRDIQLPLGYSPRYMFYRTQVTTSEQAAALISSLNLAPDDADDPSKEDRRADEALARALATDSALVDAEASNTDTTQYEREPGTVIVQRQESRFVARYRQTLPAAQAKRLRLAVGWTDLYLIDTADLIEAKRDPGHRYVREALGQLLDYAAHCTQPLNRLTALFPGKPTASDVRMLHAYGIDCLYWAGGDDFPRLEAPAAARDRIRAAWSAMGQP